MSFNSSFRGHLTPICPSYAHSTHSLPYDPASSSAGYRPPPRRQSQLRRPTSEPEPRCRPSAPSQNVTDIIPLAGHRLASATWSSSTYSSDVPPYAAVLGFSPLEIDHPATKGHRGELQGYQPRHIPWVDFDKSGSVIHPLPRTPVIPRINTPELEPVNEGGQFCDCCEEEQAQRCDRKLRTKVELQRRCMISAVPVLRGWRAVEVERMTKPG